MKSFDSVSLKLWIEQNDLTGARIQKIQQPTRRDLIFLIRKNGETKKLYININPQYYHICFMSKENEKKRHIEIPFKPPMFCMLLRKYLENAVISKINQPQYERIIEFYIETYNDLSEKIYLCLAVELMGKHSNIILYNYDTNIILGCAHNVGSEKSRERELAGTLPYIYPPNPPKQWYVSKDTFANDKSSDVNSIIDSYFAQVICEDKLYNLREKYKQIVSKKLKKEKASYSKMQYKLEKEYDCDKYRLWGDLIMANLYNRKDYSSFVKVYDYENEKEIKIELDNTKTLKDNANIFYKLYAKGKNTVNKLTELTNTAKIEIDYLEQVLYFLDLASNIDEIKMIASEMEQEKATKDNKKSFEPEEFELDGGRVWVGKNNRQNDYIVSKLSKDEDYWFHTKDCPGSHVLLRSDNPPDSLVLKCAKLAKEYSKASESSKVSVIYTKRKYLKKPPKANLGYVIYKNEREILV